MKIIMASNGKKKIKISKSEWQSIGKQAGWTKIAGSIPFQFENFAKAIDNSSSSLSSYYSREDKGLVIQDSLNPKFKGLIYSVPPTKAPSDNIEGYYSDQPSSLDLQMSWNRLQTKWEHNVKDKNIISIIENYIDSQKINNELPNRF